MWAVTILCTLLPYLILAQVDIREKKEGYTVEKSDPNAGDGEIYTSTYQLEKFFEEERGYVNDIRVIIEKKMVSKGGIQHLGSYLASFDDVIGDQDEDDDTFMHNPLNVYNLIRHVAIGWPIIEQVFDKEKAQFKEGQKFPKRVRHVTTRSKKHQIPSGNDLDGIAVGIVRLHDYYKFNLTSFASEGVLETDEWRSESNGDLTVWDAFKIGVKGANSMFLGSGIEIMLHALAKAKLESVTVPPFIEPLDQKVLKNLIKTAKTVHDQKLDRWGPRTNQHSVNPVPYDKRLGRKKKFANPKPKNVTLNNIKLWGSTQEKDQYIRLCAGEDLRPQKVQDELYCKYEHRNIPYYRYGPRKIEIVSLQPYIAVMHNFITNGETAELISKAGPKLKRSFMVSSKTSNSSLGDDNRVSEQTWFNEDMSGAAKRITGRLDGFLDVEATSTTHSELYQVANYGLAGQYTVHTDAVYITGDAIAKKQAREIWNIHAGDRAATVMGYLSDVLAGGYTVFPLVGAYVKPRKGSVVVWWNMDKAGGYDWRLRHGGCPVMVGSKWITNKWIRINSLMFKRPCPKYTPKQLRTFRFSDKYQRGEFISDP